MNFKSLTEEELKLYEAKNKDYTKGGDTYGNFNRVAQILSLYRHLKLSDPRVVCLTYLMKQLDAVLWMIDQNYEGELETIDTRLQDISVYAKIARLLGGEKCQ